MVFIDAVDFYAIADRTVPGSVICPVDGVVEGIAACRVEGVVACGSEGVVVRRVRGVVASRVEGVAFRRVCGGRETGGQESLGRRGSRSSTGVRGDSWTVVSAVRPGPRGAPVNRACCAVDGKNSAQQHFRRRERRPAGLGAAVPHSRTGSNLRRTSAKRSLFSGGLVTGSLVRRRTISGRSVPHRFRCGTARVRSTVAHCLGTAVRRRGVECPRSDERIGSTARHKW
ncbi:hypothetical protein ACVBEQ_23955 [Nakamurella sp. GG22]